MQQLDDILKFYLSSDTNHALMITGEWGTGKTFYFKNTLHCQISDTSVYCNQTKKYKPIHISLFGLKSVEQIQSEIFLSIYPLLKNKAVKLGASIFKSLIKGISKLKQLDGCYEIASDIEIKKEEWISFDELVICFDDLERISESLKLEEFIGFVNSLVENENVKILIIANEGKIDHERYHVLKEKVIGNCIEFVQDLNAIYDSIISAKFEGSPKYKSFLETHKDYILKVFSPYSTNLRTLIFALSYFQSIFSKFEINIDKQHILRSKEKEIMEALLKFTIVISIEYKEGKITYQRRNDLDSDGIHMVLGRIMYNGIQNEQVEEVEKEKTYCEMFIQRFYSDLDYHFYDSVYSFLTGGEIFSFNKLRKELEEKYNILDDKILPQYELFNMLSYPSVFSISDADYKNLVIELMKYVDLGAYNIKDYLTVFYFASTFGNPIGYNLDRLEKRVINGVKRYKNEYVPNLNVFLSIDDQAQNKERLHRIRAVALEINQRLEEKQLKLEAKRLEELCYTDFYAFKQELFNNQILLSGVRILYKPILSYFSPDKFYRLFLNADNHMRYEIRLFLLSRYYEVPPELILAERDFLTILKNKIDRKSKSLEKKGIGYYLFEKFQKELHDKIES
ncbi:P-loop NTPase fold protein [Parabacteroides sp. FAFU027]|uniref:P-loop NTPase fold protein n=1 Tax=Parabacteroides sp. FAFU027 TaxID=2922715 RepID=UPI001FAF9C3F|nr:P-loop NTPase fold protein [Parabacteroides sp. FAFU027]